jgi:cephalosporin hydroxylase
MNLNEIILFIRNQDWKTLSIDEIEKKVCSFGLNNENLNEQPPELSEFFGKGLFLWQYPKQYAPFIKFISDKKINSFYEIGCRWGGNFIALSQILKQNNPDINLSCCDIIEPSDLMKEYMKIENVTYHKGSSSSSDIIEKVRNNYDMVFIDGDHSYDGVWRDWNIFQDDLNAKYIIFHDIVSDSCGGVVQLWNQIKNYDNFNSYEFIDQYDSVLNATGNKYLGIGVLERK